MVRWGDGVGCCCWVLLLVAGGLGSGWGGGERGERGGVTEGGGEGVRAGDWVGIGWALPGVWDWDGIG